MQHRDRSFFLLQVLLFSLSVPPPNSNPCFVMMNDQTDEKIVDLTKLPAGVPKEWFVEKDLVDRSLCDLCKDVFCFPVLCPKGHNFCNSCLRDYFRDVGSTCPTCNVEIEGKYWQNYGWNMVLEAVTICEYNDCEWVGSLNYRSRHVRECRSRNCSVDLLNRAVVKQFPNHGIYVGFVSSYHRFVH